jgi:hypothetical protein
MTSCLVQIPLTVVSRLVAWNAAQAVGETAMTDDPSVKPDSFNDELARLADQLWQVAAQVHTHTGWWAADDELAEHNTYYAVLEIAPEPASELRLGAYDGAPGATVVQWPREGDPDDLNA